MNQLDKINSLKCYLIKKDIPLATKFINQREFDSLKELVDSNIHIVKRDRTKVLNGMEGKYNDIDLDMLYDLQAEVDYYLTLLNIYSDEEEY